MESLFGFLWNAMLGGVIGNATYDAIKKVIPPATFKRISDLVHQGGRNEFDKTVEVIFEANPELQNQLANLAKNGINIDNSIKTGNIEGVNIIVGHGNGR